MFGFVSVCLYMDVCVQVQAELKKRFWKWQTQSYLRYSKRRRTLFAESSTVTQISVLDKSSPKDQPVSETHALTPNNVSTVWETLDSVGPRAVCYKTARSGRQERD